MKELKLESAGFYLRFDDLIEGGSHYLDPVIRYLVDDHSFIRRDNIRWEDSSYLINFVIAENGWEFLRALIKKSLSTELKGRADYLRTGIKGPRRPPGAWLFHARRHFFKTFGMRELEGFEGNLEDILDSANGDDFNSIRDEVYIKVVDGLESQLLEAGSTLFLDTIEMQQTSADRLVPLIENQRKQEVENLVLYTKKWGYFSISEDRYIWHYDTNLMPLWATYYGFQALEKLGPQYERTWAEGKELEKVLDMVENLSGVRPTATQSHGEGYSSVELSEFVEDYIKSQASVGWWIADEVRKLGLSPNLLKLLMSLDRMHKHRDRLHHERETIRESLQNLVDAGVLFRTENWTYKIFENWKNKLPEYAEPWGGHDRGFGPKLKTPDIEDVLDERDRLEEGCCSFCGRCNTEVPVYLLKERIFCEDHYLAIKVDLLRGKTIEESLALHRRWRDSGKVLK